MQQFIKFLCGHNSGIYKTKCDIFALFGLESDAFQQPVCHKMYCAESWSPEDDSVSQIWIFQQHAHNYLSLEEELDFQIPNGRGLLILKE